MVKEELGSLKIKLIAFDSMGVRSMATVVETSDVKIFIDPGASLAPRRYGLPPHPIELEELSYRLDIIRKELEDSDIVIISHYHYDHYLYHSEDTDYYRGKILLVKHPEQDINRSQRIRAYVLLKKNNVLEKARRIEYADARVFRYGETTIVFSEPVPHGDDGTPLGYVLMTLIVEGDEKFVHTSDVQGPISDRALKILLEWKPTEIVLCGPPTYFAGYKVPMEIVERGLYNMKRLVEESGIRYLVVDHHLLRDIDYRLKIRDLLEAAASRSVTVTTAAEYMGFNVRQLEAYRKDLWGRDNGK